MVSMAFDALGSIRTVSIIMVLTSTVLPCSFTAAGIALMSKLLTLEIS